MIKEEIGKKIFELQTDEEIVDFINQRLKVLEDESVEKTVGQNYTDSFRDFISEKVHYKASANIGDSECPDLVYDDITPYFNLIKAIKEENVYNEVIVFTKIFFTIYEYLPNDDMLGMDRFFVYSSNKGKRVSIKTIRESGVTFCSEKAGLAHNMFKLLGIDSEVVLGSRNNEFHAYNIIYPSGYDNEPMILYDPSHFVKAINSNGRKISFGFFKAFDRQTFESLKSGNPIKIDLSSTERLYRMVYGGLDGYVFENDPSVYVFGIENAKKYKNSSKQK